MTKYGMVIDLEKCIGCNACAAACLTENLNSPALYKNPPLPKIIEEASKSDGARAGSIIKELLWMRTKVKRIYKEDSIIFYHNICQHCDDAPCVMVCPTGATFQRKDGIVLVDYEKCVLCGYCIVACPYAARHINPITRTVDKCTFCSHRVDKGQLPACVETCPTEARKFGDLDDPESEVARLVREGAVPGSNGSCPNSKPNVYVIPHTKHKKVV